jgi:hypothetical protein
MICYGMAVKRVGMLAVSVRKIKALTVNMDTVTLIDEGRWILTCLVYDEYEVNSKIFFLNRLFLLGNKCLFPWQTFLFWVGCLRLESSYIQVNTVCVFFYSIFLPFPVLVKSMEFV